MEENNTLTLNVVIGGKSTDIVINNMLVKDVPNEDGTYSMDIDYHLIQDGNMVIITPELNEEATSLISDLLERFFDEFTDKMVKKDE